MKGKEFRYIKEQRITADNKENVGDEINVSVFAEGDIVKISGVSKGKGYQGVMKKHHFLGGPAAHGSGFHRHAGSTGMRTTPGRCLPGGKKAGRMGGENRTIQNLEVVGVDETANVILIKGAIPGGNGGVVFITKAKKG